jgi:fumarylacetoacetate (FAA) hydrolase
MRLVRYGHEERMFVGSLQGAKVTPLAAPNGSGDRELLELAMRRDADSIGPELSVDEVRLLPPLARPSTIRDFLTFEEHYANFLQGRHGDATIPDEWYRTPVFYFSTPHRVFGHDETAPRPVTDQLDYELEVAVVLGKDGSDLDEEAAIDAIAGYTMFNDLSARDIQSREMALGLGASKCKDFANVFGPCLVTPDELPGEPGRPSARLAARVNGKPHGEHRLERMQHSFVDMIRHASRGSTVRAGDVLGSGTCATGCIIELAGLYGHDAYPWLEAGDVVEIEGEGIGILRTVIGPRPA